MNIEIDCLLEDIKTYVTEIGDCWLLGLGDIFNRFNSYYTEYTLYPDNFELLIEVQDGEEFGEVCICRSYEELDFDDLVELHSILKEEYDKRGLL